MKKFYFIICAAVCASMAFAANPLTRGSVSMPQPQELKRSTPAKHSASRADYSVISQVSGTPEAKNFNCTYFEPYYGKLTFGDFPHYVVVDGNDVYLQDIVAGISLNTWVKGEKDGNSVNISLPQAVFYQPNYDEYVLMCVLKSNGKGGYVYDNEVTEVTLDITSDGFWTLDLGNSIDDENPQSILGLVWESDLSWIESYGDSWFEVGDLLYEKEPIPTDVNMEEWAMTDTYYADMCKVGIKDDNVYIQGLYPDFPDAFIQGKIDGDGIVFKSQYMGLGSGYYLFFSPYDADLDGSLQLDETCPEYDAIQKIIVAPQTQIWFCCQSDQGVEYGYIDYLEQAKFFYQTPEDMNADPTDPIFYIFMDYDPAYGYGGISWFAAPVNVNGFVLNPANLYINMYINGEAWPLTPEITGLDKDMYDIPFGYNSPNGDFGCYGTQFIYYLNAPLDFEVTSLGCQLVYNGSDGVEYKSKLVTEQLAGIAEIGFKEVKSESFVNLSGITITNPQHGIFIKTTVFNDGTSKVEKVIIH